MSICPEAKSKIIQVELWEDSARPSDVTTSVIGCDDSDHHGSGMRFHLHPKIYLPSCMKRADSIDTSRIEESSTSI
jgi:hypothetical protein